MIEAVDSSAAAVKVRLVSPFTASFSFSKYFVSVWCHSSSLSLRKISPKNIKPLSKCFSKQTSHKSSSIDSFAYHCIKTIILDCDQITR